MMGKYSEAKDENLPPHVYHVAKTAYSLVSVFSLDSKLPTWKPCIFAVPRY